MPDKRELYFWNSLDPEPNADEDNDGYTNIQEIGFQVPLYNEEKRSPYSIKANEVNPLDDQVYPGHPRPDIPIEEETDDTKGLFDTIPIWLFIILVAVVVVIVTIAVGIVVVLRISKKKDEEEDADLERRVEEMDRRQKELAGLYGIQKAGDAVGPDQSTLDDLTLDLGGQIYHEEGKRSLISASDEKDRQKGEEKKPTGPAWESGTGPLFEDSAPGLEFGESMEVDTMEIDPDVTEIEAEEVDEGALAESMDSLMDAAEEFDEEAVKDAGGGNVLVGAVPMEEQVKQLQGGQAPPQGPRVPPPGQAPPAPQETPPGQRPPQPPEEE
jgi:hypothetical protein